MKIAVLRPTRGIEFSESANSVEANLDGLDHVILRTWDRPIPDSFNALAKAFLETTADLAWFVEEDIVVPPGGLAAMIALGTDISAVLYKLKLEKRFCIAYREGAVLWLGLGCTLVKRAVFERMQEPWFSTDYQMISRHSGSACKVKTLELRRSPVPYGGQDIYFSFQAKKLGFNIAVVDGMLCDHLSIESMGEPHKNNGCHKIARI